MVNTDPLTREKVANEMIAALPLELCIGDRQLDNQKDFTGLFVHACMIASGYKLQNYGRLPKDTADILRRWFILHVHHPYPTEDEKMELARQTGLQPLAISNWFMNARSRQLPSLMAYGGGVHPEAEAEAYRLLRIEKQRHSERQSGGPTHLPDDLNKRGGLRSFVYTHWTSEHIQTSVVIKDLDDPSDPRNIFEVKFEATEYRRAEADRPRDNRHVSQVYCEVFKVRALINDDALPLQIPHHIYQGGEFRLHFSTILKEGPFHWLVSNIKRILPLLLKDPHASESIPTPPESTVAQTPKRIIDLWNVLPPGPPVTSRPSSCATSPSSNEASKRLRENDYMQEIPNANRPLGWSGDELVQPNPRRPVPAGDFPPPDFEDEHQINTRPGNLMTGQTGPRFPIGHDDLHPPGLGPHDPLRSSLTDSSRGMPGTGGMYPSFSPQARPNIRWDPVGPGVPPPQGFGGPGIHPPPGFESPQFANSGEFGSSGGMMGSNNGDPRGLGVGGPPNFGGLRGPPNLGGLGSPDFGGMGGSPGFGGMGRPPGLGNRRGGPGSGNGYGGMGGGFGGGII